MALLTRVFEEENFGFRLIFILFFSGGGACTSTMTLFSASSTLLETLKGGFQIVGQIFSKYFENYELLHIAQLPQHSSEIRGLRSTYNALEKRFKICHIFVIRKPT